MLSFSAVQSGLLRSLSGTQSEFQGALQRLATGSRINRASDDPAGVVRVSRLRAEVGGATAQLANAVRLDGMIDTASAAVNSQVGLLQDMRSLAVTAASDTSSTSDRLALQTQLNALVDDFDRVATTTTFSGRRLLDGSMGTSRFAFGAAESAGVTVGFESTRATAVGQVAEVVGTRTTTTALATGELVINGISVEDASAATDLLSSADNAASAIATAAAINLADAGVTATAGPTELNLGAVTAGSFVAGDLVINGADIGTVSVTANDAGGDLVNAINAQSSSTGVVAELNAANELVLSANDGRNIVTSGNDTNGSGVVSVDPGAATYTGTVVLTSDADIEITGTNPASAGLSPGTTTVGAASVATLDLTSSGAADTALRRIDAALAELSAVQSDFAAASSQVAAASSVLASSQVQLTGTLGQIQDANFASELARLSGASFLGQAQIALLAQANVDSAWVLDLL